MSQSPAPSAPTQLRWSGSTDRGRKRPNNEDAFIGLRFDAEDLHHLGSAGTASLDTMDYVFAVSDGMGGAKAGEYASRIAVDKITHLLPKAFRQAASGLDSGAFEILDELFDRIHQSLVYHGNAYAECNGMETTLSLCWLTPGWMHFAHIGDSRIYYLPASGSGLRQVTEDDTHVGWLLRNGKINEREARTHPRRNVLQKALGGGNQFVDPQSGKIACEPGDTFLLCSDGLNEGLTDQDLANILLYPVTDSTAPRLVTTAVENDGRDNTTAIVLQLGSA